MNLPGVSIKDRKIRLALVGCGRISRHHIYAIEKHSERCERTDLYDTDADALAPAIEKTGAKGRRNLTGMLEGADTDYVILATPSGLNPGRAIEVAQVGAPARQIGWMSEFGERIDFLLSGHAETNCAAPGRRYVLRHDEVNAEQQGV